MYFSNIISTIPTPVMIAVCVAVVALSFYLLRKSVVSDHNKMLKAQDFAIQNPEKIEKIKLVDNREIYCVVTIQDKEPEIIAEGVKAVRLYDQLIVANPKLKK